MKHQKTIFWLLLLALSISTKACITTKKYPDQSGLKALSRLMEGSYNSAAQAATDTNYFDISLHMYPIWETSGGRWLYVEQALSSKPEKPYRQRIYHLEQISKVEFKTTVFEINNPEQFIGK